MYLAEMAWLVSIFLFHGKKYSIRILSKTRLSTRITKAMSSLSHFTCYCNKLDVYPKKPCSFKILL